MDQSIDNDVIYLENSRLQLKLRAQEAVCQKLMTEKAVAVQSCEESEEKIRLLQHEFEMKERMFLKIREDHEREISTLKSIKQDLEARLLSAMDSPGEPMEDLESERRFSAAGIKSTFSVLPKLSANEAVDALSKWEGMDSTIAVLQSVMDSEDQVKWKPGSPWVSKWKFVLTLYISAPLDTTADVHKFFQDFLPRIQQKCRASGCCINPVVMSVAEIRAVLTDEQLIEYSANIVEKADMFVSLLKDEADELTKVELERGFLNSPSIKPGIFVLLPHSNSSSVQPKTQNARRLKDRVRKMKGLENASVYECDEDLQDALLWLSKEISQALMQKFDVVEIPKGKSYDLVERVTLQEDMKIEWEQTQILWNLMENSPTAMVGVDEVFVHLEGYLNDDGPVAPMLLTGSPGSGKSSIIAKWIEELMYVQDRTVVVFYHFVNSLCLSSAELTVIYRRFIQKMMYYCEDLSGIACCPTQLEQDFVNWLEKMSTQMSNPQDRLVIVIDGADLITDHEKYLTWVCKPLPNRARVVLSANDDNYPDAWRSLPSPSIPTPTSSDLRDIINNVQYSSRSQSLSDDHVGLLAISAPELPLWCVLATKYLQRCTDLSCDEFDQLIEDLDEYREVPDLVGHLLDSLDAQYPTFADGFEKILKLVYCSRNGLLLSEIASITGMPSGLVYCLLFELQSRSIVSSATSVLFALTNEQIQEGVLLKYSGTSCRDHLQMWTYPLLNFFSDYTSEKTLFARCVEELPWLLKRAELHEELLNIILDVDFLIFFFSSGRTGELLRYWTHLGNDPSVIAKQYYTILLRMEESQSVPASEMSSLFKTVGKILMQLEFTEQALQPLQHALELSESFLDPDSKELGSTMYELASLHFAVERLSTAETLFKHSLELFESTCDEGSPLLLKVLQDLAVLYKKMGKNELADGIYARMLAIKDASEHPSMEASHLLQKRAEELEELCSSSSYSKQLASFLNELGVIFAVYGDNDIAEEKFLQSLKLFETVAPGDAEILIILKNLGRFYLQRNRYDLAIPLCENVYEFTAQNLPERHPEVMLATEKLALLYREQGNLQRAEFLQRKLLTLKVEDYGEQHLEVAKVLNNLAVLCCLKGDFAQGVPYYEQAIAIYGDKLGVEHTVTLAAINNKQLALSNVP